jgi:hypothetical protein
MSRRKKYGSKTHIWWVQRKTWHWNIGRKLYARRMRENGYGYKDIGDMIGVSHERARQLVFKGQSLYISCEPEPAKSDVYQDYLEEIADINVRESS